MNGLGGSLILELYILYHGYIAPALIELWLFIILALPVPTFEIVGPGAISYAGEGVLEAVAERRTRNGWGMTGDYTAYDVLVAPSDCKLLDRAGWLMVDGKILTVKVADCEANVHKGMMESRGLLADANLEELTHLEGWLFLK